jgi:hypothetical protein
MGDFNGDGLLDGYGFYGEQVIDESGGITFSQVFEVGAAGRGSVEQPTCTVPHHIW